MIYLKLISLMRPAAGYGARASDYFNNAGITAGKTEINSFFNNLNSYGLIDLNDSSGASDLYYTIYLPFHGSASQNKYNALRPTDTDADFRLTFYGGWTHQSTGLLGNGSNAYGDTHLNENTILTFEDAHISVYSRTDTDGLYCDIGVTGNALYETNIFSKYSNVFYPRVQATNSGIANSANSKGLFIANRVSSTEVRAYQDGSLKQITNTSNNKSSANIYIGALNRAAVGDIAFYSPREYTLFSIGKGLTDQRMSDYTTCVNTLMTALGLNV